MKITKVSAYKHYKYADKGMIVSTLTDNNVDETDTHVCDLKVEASIKHKYLVFKKPKYGMELMLYNVIESYFDYLLGAPIKASDIKTSLFKTTLINFKVKGKHLYSATSFINYYLTEKGKYLKDHQPNEVGKSFLHILLSIIEGADIETESAKLKNKLTHKALMKRAALVKSLQHNKVMFHYKDDLIQPQSMKGLWLSYLLKQSFIQCDLYSDIMSIFPAPDYKCIKTYTQELKYNLMNYEKEKGIYQLNKEIKTLTQAAQASDFVYDITPHFESIHQYFVLLEIRKYFKHYFPLQGRRKKMRLDNHINEKYLDYYSHIDNIQHTIKHQIENMMVQHAISIAKLSCYRQEEKLTQNYFTTDDMTHLKMKEDLKKKLIHAHNVAFNRYQIQEENNAISELLQAIKLKCMHFNSEELSDIFKVDIKLPALFEAEYKADVNALTANYAAVLKARQLTSHYSKENLMSILNTMPLSIKHPSLCYIPAFKHLFKKASNIQKSNHLLIDHTGWYLLNRNMTQYQYVYKNLLQLIYHDSFLSSPLLIDYLKNAVVTVLAVNKRMAKLNNKSGMYEVYLYKEIRSIEEAETFDQYMEYLEVLIKVNQSHITHDMHQNLKPNKYILFLHDIYLKAFNQFLDDHYHSCKEIMQNPQSQGYHEYEVDQIVPYLKLKESTTLLENINVSVYLFFKLLDNKTRVDVLSDLLRYHHHIEGTQIEAAKLSDYASIGALIQLTNKGNTSLIKKQMIDQVAYYKRIIPSYNHDSTTSFDLEKIETYHQINKSIHDFYVMLTKQKSIELEALVLYESKRHSYEHNIHSINAYYANKHKNEGIELETLKTLDTKLMARLNTYIKDIEKDAYYFLTYYELVGLNPLVPGYTVDNVFNKTLEEISKLINPVFKETYWDKYFIKKKVFKAINKTETEVFKAMDEIILNKRYTQDTCFSYLDYINIIRALLSYDRKRKNMVTKSMINLFDQYGYTLVLHFKGNHIESYTLTSKYEEHFKKALPRCYERKTYVKPLKIPIHSSEVISYATSILSYHNHH